MHVLAQGIILFLVGMISGLQGQQPDLFDAFDHDWHLHWEHRSFSAHATVYDVVREGERAVLHAQSSRAHGGLFRKVEVLNPATAMLAWRWKIRAPLVNNLHEREKSGDDFAARVLVIFETSLLPWRNRVINYVWSAHEPAGSVYPSAYSKSIATIVIRSGAASAGVWMSEQRNILEDYRAYFREAPTRISAVAVLVDTDDTRLAAEAWFESLALSTTPSLASAPSKSP